MQQTILLLALLTATAAAQLPPPNDAGVAMGHLHLLVSDPDLHRKLWVDGLGAKPAMLGPIEVLLLPDTVILLRKGEPTGGSEGSVINHLGFLVRDREAIEARWRAAGGEIYERRPSPSQVFLRFPDNIKVELTEDPELKVDVAHHHIHFYSDEMAEIRAWYIERFGAVPSHRGKFETAELPGVELAYWQVDERPAPTEGRAVDHIGFEVDNLEAFCRKLESQGVTFDTPYRYVDRLAIGLAFFTDPWGTRVELTEGLDKL